MSTILPIVNNNGTSRTELIQQRRDVFVMLDGALNALRQMSPHGRDYQTDPTGEQFKLAERQHARRVRAVTDLRNEFMNEAAALYRSEDKQSVTPEQVQATIEAATAEVATWPAWKQNILEQSASPTVSPPRKPIINE